MKVDTICFHWICQFNWPECTRMHQKAPRIWKFSGGGPPDRPLGARPVGPRNAWPFGPRSFNSKKCAPWNSFQVAQLANWTFTLSFITEVQELLKLHLLTYQQFAKNFKGIYIERWVFHKWNTHLSDALVCKPFINSPQVAQIIIIPNDKVFDTSCLMDLMEDLILLSCSWSSNFSSLSKAFFQCSMTRASLKTKWNITAQWLTHWPLGDFNEITVSNIQANFSDWLLR